MNRLASALIGTKAPDGDVIVKVGPNPDHSGLVVTLAPGATTDADRAAVLALDPEALASRAPSVRATAADRSSASVNVRSPDAARGS